MRHWHFLKSTCDIRTPRQGPHIYALTQPLFVNYKRNSLTLFPVMARSLSFMRRSRCVCCLTSPRTRVTRWTVSSSFPWSMALTSPDQERTPSGPTAPSATPSTPTSPTFCTQCSTTTGSSPQVGVFFFFLFSLIIFFFLVY